MTTISNELLITFCRNFKHDGFVGTVAHAANIKIKRNLKKKGFIGYRTVVHLMKCVQVQKNATEESGVNNFNYLLHFFARTVSLRIPSFFNFVNPFFVSGHFWATMQTQTD
jgi:hypothetical protein